MKSAIWDFFVKIFIPSLGLGLLVISLERLKPELLEDSLTISIQNGEVSANANSPRLEKFFDSNVREEVKKYADCFKEPASIEVVNYTTTMTIKIHGYADAKDAQSKVETLGCFMALKFLYCEKKNLALKTNNVAYINPLPENRCELCINIKTGPMR